jgi:hypothetical protein
MDNKKPSRNWFGHLTTSNIDDVVSVLNGMLKEQKYTFASMRWSQGFEPKMDVRTSQELKDEISIYQFSNTHSGFHVLDSYGLWGVSTVGNGAFISFEHWKVIIQHESPSGNKLTWIIALEQ